MAIHIHGDETEGVTRVKDTERLSIADLAHDADDLVWVVDEDEPLDPATLVSDLESAGKKELVRHRCKKINISVSYNGIQEIIRVSPARKVRAVIRKAVRVDEFAIDPSASGDLELRRPGSDEAIDPSMPVGRLVRHGKCELSLDLMPSVRHAG